jgi:O-Antigen ligase
MSSPAVAFRPRDAVLPRTAQADERLVRRRVGIVWGLLFLDALTFSAGGPLHIPGVVGKGITQGALVIAFLVALSINRRVVVRPNVFLCLVTLLVIGAIITSLQPQFFGTIYRTFRLALYVATLWLLTPWWGRRDFLLVRCHIKALAVVLCTVLLGLFVFPGHAIAGGRLAGVIWPIAATQVAHYAAVMTGLVVMMWLCGHLRNRVTLVVVLLALVILILTHTRTALIGMIAGILVGGLSLIVAKQRARKLFATAGVVTAIGIMTLSGFITTWLARGEGTQQLTELTGRTPVWAALVNFPRNKFQEIFGFGLSNGSFNGLSIDSNWLASYQEQGLWGDTICAIALLFLLVVAYFKPRGLSRALALFLITYCLIASFTEVGFTDASTYLLELTLAASLIVPAVTER